MTMCFVEVDEMSMNLHFETRKGGHIIDFPYQTRTDTSYAVLKAETIEEKMSILRNDDSQLPERVFRECERMLKDKSLRLIVL